MIWQVYLLIGAAGFLLVAGMLLLSAMGAAAHRPSDYRGRK